MGPTIPRAGIKIDAPANPPPPDPNYDLTGGATNIDLPPDVAYRVNSAARPSDTVQEPKGGSQSLLLYLKRSDLPEQIKFDNLIKMGTQKSCPGKSAVADF